MDYLMPRSCLYLQWMNKVPRWLLKCFSQIYCKLWFHPAEHHSRLMLLISFEQLGLVTDAYLLLAKLHYVMGMYEEALKNLNVAGLNDLTEKSLPNRILRVVAESFAVKGNLFQSQSRYDFYINNFMLCSICIDPWFSSNNSCTNRILLGDDSHTVDQQIQAERTKRANHQKLREGWWLVLAILARTGQESAWPNCNHPAYGCYHCNDRIKFSTADKLLHAEDRNHSRKCSSESSNHTH